MGTEKQQKLWRSHLAQLCRLKMDEMAQMSHQPWDVTQTKGEGVHSPRPARYMGPGWVAPAACSLWDCPPSTLAGVDLIFPGPVFPPPFPVTYFLSDWQVSLPVHSKSQPCPTILLTSHSGFILPSGALGMVVLWIPIKGVSTVCFGWTPLLP